MRGSERRSAPASVGAREGVGREGEGESARRALTEDGPRAPSIDAACAGERALTMPSIAPRAPASAAPRRDYKAVEALDHYEADGMDEDVEEPLDLEEQQAARQAAEEAMARRDNAAGIGMGARMPELLRDDDNDEDGERPRRRRRLDGPAASGDTEGGAGDYEEEVKLEQVEGPLLEFIARPRTRREIKKRFKRFLESFEVDQEYVYKSAIHTMCSRNSQSLEVNYVHLSHMHPILAIWVADAPQPMLKIFDEIAKEVVLDMFPEYDRIRTDVFVRITGLPILDSIRDIRQQHLNALIKISGVVTRRTGVFPQLQSSMYDCAKCGFLIGPIQQDGFKELTPGACPACQSMGPFSINVEKTVYRNYQKITLQESPGSVPAGRLPRSKEVVVQDDLIDQARPGEEVEITGVYTNSFDRSLNTKNGFPVFSTVVEANYLSKREDAYAVYRLTDKDKEDVLKLSKDPRIAQRIVKSIAPSIYGHKHIKTSLALSMFGGQEKNVAGKHRLRGDINVLLLGDPGTAKSQFLKYVEKTAHRAVYTTGKGASAVGLTAAVQKDPVTREWTLEGGALVLADRGVCLIDEFDKMNDQDRVSIHEAMEQQSISISKAGIVTSLQARCAVIAAANPINGRYNSSRTFGENVELTEPILSRFDCLCVVKDIVDPVQDESLARFVVNSHARSHPDGVAEGDAEADAMSSLLREGDADLQPLQQEQLRKYITYAKSTVKPKLRASDATKIQHVYANLRQTSLRGQGVPVAVRHIESIIRMAESHAKMHLREYVSSSDVDVAIRTLLQSFISTQKDSVQRSLQRSFQQYLGGASDYDELLMHALKALVRDAVTLAQVQEGAVPAAVSIPLENLEAKAAEHEITDLQPFLRGTVFDANGFEFKPDERVILKDIAA